MRPRWRSVRSLLWLLFLVHCGLRLAGIGWNVEHHSAFPTQEVPTYHIDEYLLIDGLRSNYRLFSDYSILTDGPLSLNLTYLPLRLGGERPPETWHAARALLAGRWISALSDCLAFPLLWGLLLDLGVSEGIALLGVAVLAFSPNHVFNAHFARSHTLAGLLQLATWFAAARCLTAASRRRCWAWFSASALAAILAGASRYPFLTLGIFPAAAAGWLLVRSWRRRELARDLAGFAAGSAAALAAGVTIGFDLRPLEILRAGFQAQQAVGQLPWNAAGAIAQSAANKVLSTLSFPGGSLRAVLLLVLPAGLLLGPRDRGSHARAFVLLIAGWALLYLVLWAKFNVPWQRYSMPFSLSMGIAGIFAFDRLVRRAAGRWPAARWRAAAIVVAVALLLPGASLSILTAWRFFDDKSNPHYRLSLELARLRPGAVYVHEFWSWNRAILSQLVPPSTTLRFVPDREAACRMAGPGDVLVDFAMSPLGGPCVTRAITPAFRLSNLGPPGYPFPANVGSSSWPERHWEDYHYLFEDIRGFTVQAASGAVSADVAGSAGPAAP